MKCSVWPPLLLSLLLAFQRPASAIRPRIDEEESEAASQKIRTMNSKNHLARAEAEQKPLSHNDLRQMDSHDGHDAHVGVPGQTSTSSHSSDASSGRVVSAWNISAGPAILHAAPLVSEAAMQGDGAHEDAAAASPWPPRWSWDEVQRSAQALPAKARSVLALIHNVAKEELRTPRGQLSAAIMGIIVLVVAAFSSHWHHRRRTTGNCFMRKELDERILAATGLEPEKRSALLDRFCGAEAATVAEEEFKATKEVFAAIEAAKESIAKRLARNGDYNEL